MWVLEGGKDHYATKETNDSGRHAPSHQVATCTGLAPTAVRSIRWQATYIVVRSVSVQL